MCSSLHVSARIHSVLKLHYIIHEVVANNIIVLCMDSGQIGAYGPTKVFSVTSSKGSIRAEWTIQHHSRIHASSLHRHFCLGEEEQALTR